MRFSRYLKDFEGYRKVEEVGRKNFHQVASKSELVGPSYGLKTAVARFYDKKLKKLTSIKLTSINF